MPVVMTPRDCKPALIERFTRKQILLNFDDTGFGTESKNRTEMVRPLTRSKTKGKGIDLSDIEDA